MPVWYSSSFRSPIVLFANGAIVHLEVLYREEQSCCLAKRLESKQRFITTH